MTKTHAPLYLSGLTKSYGSQIVVRDINLTLPGGEVTALVGPSGAGKTTLMRLIAGVDRPDEGTIRSGETVLSSPARHVPAERRQIGLVFQDFALFPHLNVTGNIMFGLTHLPQTDREALTRSWIDRLGLTNRAAAYPHHLSGGEQQRVAIARALAPSPRVLLMDEPFSGLDPERRETSRDIALRAVREAGIPALLVTHDPVEALAHADTVAVMQNGQIIQTGTPDRLYMTPDNLAVAKALGRVQSVERAAFPATIRATLPDSNTVHLRPEALRINPAGALSMQVISAHRRGTLCELRLGTEDLRLTCVAILPKLPRVGDTLQVTLDPAYCLRFSATDN